MSCSVTQCYIVFFAVAVFFFLTARCRLCTGCSSPLFSCVRSDVHLKNGFKQGNPIKGISKSFPLWTKGTRSVTVVNATYRKSRKSPPRTKFRRGVDFLADKRSKKIRCSSALIGMYIPTVVLTFSMTLTKPLILLYTNFDKKGTPFVHLQLKMVPISHTNSGSSFHYITYPNS